MQPEAAPPLEVLAAFGVTGEGAAASLAGGAVNSIWRIHAPGGSVVIRGHHGGQPAASLEWEHRLMAFAATRSWPAPTALQARGGGTVYEHDGRTWSAHCFLEGSPPDGASIANRRINGRLLARLHRDLQGFEESEQRPGLGKVWELDLKVQHAEPAGFNTLLAAFEKEHAELARRIRRERYRNLRELSRLHYPDLPERIIHGDFHPKNLLFQDAQLTGVLDFEQARRDALACDIAPILMPFQPLEPALSRAFLEGYESVRALSEAEWELLPALVRAALLWWVSFLLAGWRTGTRPGALDGIVRTMNQRFPAFDAAEAGLRALRTR